MSEMKIGQPLQHECGKGLLMFVDNELRGSAFERN